MSRFNIAVTWRFNIFECWTGRQFNIQKCWTVDRRHVQHSIVTNVTWRRFDQSAKQLVVGRTTTCYATRVVADSATNCNLFVRSSGVAGDRREWAALGKAEAEEGRRVREGKKKRDGEEVLTGAAQIVDLLCLRHACRLLNGS